MIIIRIDDETPETWEHVKTCRAYLETHGENPDIEFTAVALMLSDGGARGYLAAVWVAGILFGMSIGFSVCI